MKRRLAVFCPDSAGQRVAEMVLVASDTSTYRRMAQDRPIRVMAHNVGCSRYVGSASGTEHLHTANRNTTETWNATGLVYQRDLTGGNDDTNFHYKLVGGSVTWTYGGVFDGCAVSAGPVTLQFPADDHNSWAQVQTWINGSPARRYYAAATDLPIVHGTMTCSYGTYNWDVRPHQVLDTGDQSHHITDARGDGILDGTFSWDEATGGARDVSYSWHLEPRP